MGALDIFVFALVFSVTNTNQFIHICVTRVRAGGSQLQCGHRGALGLRVYNPFHGDFI